MKFKWEMISSMNAANTCRAKVFGGWIVNNMSYIKEPGTYYPQQVCESSVFLPDAEHKWEIEEA